MKKIKKQRISLSRILRDLFLIYLFYFAPERRVINFGKNYSKLKVWKLLFQNCKKLSSEQKILIAREKDDPYFWELVILDQRISLSKIISLIKKNNPFNWPEMILKRQDFIDYIKKISTVDAIIFIKNIEDPLISKFIISERFDVRYKIAELKLRRPYLTN